MKCIGRYFFKVFDVAEKRHEIKTMLNHDGSLPEGTQPTTTSFVGESVDVSLGHRRTPNSCTGCAISDTDSFESILLTPVVGHVRS